MTNTILVVDDELSIRETLRDLLEDEGYSVLTASNGQEGLNQLSRVHPDVVLCDVMMPGIDGREMCKRMTNNPAYQSIPIVLMSAVNTIPRNIDCNYKAFLEKPFDLDEVLTIVEQLIRARAS